VKFILVVLFILVSIPFFYLGKHFITSDYQKYIIEGTKTAKDNKLYLNRVKARAELVSQFIEKNSRYPSREEVSCDFKECEKYQFLFWDIVKLGGNNFIISYSSPGVMFTPAQAFTLYYNPNTNLSNFDHKLEPWQLKVWFFFVAIGNLCIMWLPLVIWLFDRLFCTAKKPNKSLKQDK
jgi:hypothetical protein